MIIPGRFPYLERVFLKITIIAFGTRGDVQPLIALASALQACGHRVRMIASANFNVWIEGHGLEAARTHVDVQAMMQGTLGREWVEKGNSPIRQAQAMKRLLAEYGLPMMHDAWQASQDAQVIISSFTSDVYAASIAEKLGAKHISTPLQPTMRATRYGTSTAAALLPNGASIVNYWFGKLFIEPFGWRLIGKIHNRFRREVLRLPAQSRRENDGRLRRMLVAQGISSHVVPHPPDFPPNIHTTGFWFLDDDRDWTPPPKLAEFLRTGAPPVYIGFGSMTGHNPEAMTRTLTQAVVQSKQRTILQTGWANLGSEELPPEIFLLDSAPHNRLFSYVSGAIHHGGAGTTAESLRAGIPTLVIPHMADQPFWGARVAALGVGPQPIARPKLTAALLARRIAQMTGDPAMRRRAVDLGAKIRAEDGIGNAVRVIETYLRT